MSQLYRYVRDKTLRRVQRRLRRWPAWLMRGHRLLPGLIWGGERAYPFAGGQIYLDVREKPWVRAMALGVFERLKIDALHWCLKPGMTFVDVGANTGYFALIAARLVGPAGRVLAVEPEPENCERIRRNIELNGYQNIDVAQVALGDRQGDVELHLAHDHGHHSLLPTSPDRAGLSLTVPLRTLDDLLVEHRIDQVDAMKIDVEGAEATVLRGAAATVRKNPRIVLLIDLHESLGIDPAEVCDLLVELGLAIFQVKPPYDRPTGAAWHPLELLARAANARADS